MTGATGQGPGPISRWLAADHGRLDDLLRRALSGPGGIDRGPYGEFRRGLLRHIGIEGTILLPAARRAHGGRPLPIFERIRLDHGAISALLVPTPTPLIVRTLVGILEGHNRLEEGPDGLYASCDRLLGPEAEALVREMAAYPDPPLNPHNDGPAVMDSIRRILARAGYALSGGAEG